VISVLVYGRNDAHGYNPHRRVALSLNCIAEVLTDPDDEIVYVDYNSPDQLPTLVEALADTLTERCRSLLRVLRVRPSVHTRRFASRTHLGIVEPVARNAAARRSNPANRWLLSTTTDMILIPREDRSLSEICAELPDGFYGLPRFELPEWLWESQPRSDPRAAMAEIERLGPALHLDETIVSHDAMRFDAPGDFQLVLRRDFFAIDGFDEEMVLGWHVDANLSKRLLLHRGAIESLEDDVAGYHCNHHRTPTVYHGTEVANDLGHFFHRVDRVELPAQRETWGLAGVTLEETSLHDERDSAFTSAVRATLASDSSSPACVDARDTKYSLEYDSSHALPFIADALRVSRSDATIAYIGANAALEELLATLIGELDSRRSFTAAELENHASIAQLDRDTEVFIVDLGIDSSLLGSPLATAKGEEPARLRGRLVRAFVILGLVVELERARLRRGEQERAFVLINSAAVFWNAYVQAHMHCSSTTSHSRIRHAVVRPNADRGATAVAAERRADQLLRWIRRRDSGFRRIPIRPGETVEIASLGSYSGFGDGWTMPDREGVWTQGPKAELSLSLSQSVPEASTLTLWFDRVDQRPGESLAVSLLANGACLGSCEIPPTASRSRRRDGVRDTSRTPIRRPLAWLRAQAQVHGVTRIRPLRWLFIRGLELRSGAGSVLGLSPRAKYSWRVAIPPDVSAGGEVDLELVIHEPVDWLDDRRRGLHLRSLTQDGGRPRMHVPLDEAMPTEVESTR